MPLLKDVLNGMLENDNADEEVEAVFVVAHTKSGMLKMIPWTEKNFITDYINYAVNGFFTDAALIEVAEDLFYLKENFPETYSEIVEYIKEHQENINLDDLFKMIWEIDQEAASEMEKDFYGESENSIS